MIDPLLLLCVFVLGFGPFLPVGTIVFVSLSKRPIIFLASTISPVFGLVFFVFS